MGDAADGFPGIAGIGAKTAARLIAKHGHIEEFPEEVLRHQKEQALLFKHLATLRADAPLFKDVEELRWRRATDEFLPMAKEIGGRVARLIISRNGADE